MSDRISSSHMLIRYGNAGLTMWNFGYARLGCVNLAALNENRAVFLRFFQVNTDWRINKMFRNVNSEDTFVVSKKKKPTILILPTAVANLLKKIRQHDAPEDEKRAVYHHQWGGAVRMASARLQHHLKTLFQDMTYGYVIVSKVNQVSIYTNIHADVNDQKTQLQKWLHSVSARFFSISSDCTVGLASNIWICFRKEGYAALFSFCDCKGDNC